MAAAACGARGGGDAAEAVVGVGRGGHHWGTRCGAVMTFDALAGAPQGLTPCRGAIQVVDECTPRRLPVTVQSCGSHAAVTRRSLGGHTAVIRKSYSGHSAAQRSPQRLMPSRKYSRGTVVPSHVWACINAVLRGGEGEGFCCRGCVQRWARQMATSWSRRVPPRQLPWQSAACAAIEGVGAGDHLWQAAVEVRRRAASTGCIVWLAWRLKKVRTA
jgi:hypothetical protein